MFRVSFRLHLHLFRQDHDVYHTKIDSINYEINHFIKYFYRYLVLANYLPYLVCTPSELKTRINL